MVPVTAGKNELSPLCRAIQFNLVLPAVSVILWRPILRGQGPCLGTGQEAQDLTVFPK
jgi:hypothetical protein